MGIADGMGVTDAHGMGIGDGMGIGIPSFEMSDATMLAAPFGKFSCSMTSSHAGRCAWIPTSPICSCKYFISTACMPGYLCTRRIGSCH